MDPFNIQQAHEAYLEFRDVAEANELALKDKIKAWQKMSASPEVLLMLFCVMIMNSGGPFDNLYSEKTGMEPGRASIAGREEDKIEETGKQMNYVTAYRNAITEIKRQIDNGNDGEGSLETIKNTLAIMADPNNWDTNIFQGASEATFRQALADVNSVIADMDARGWSLSDLWKISQMGPGDPDYDQAEVTAAGNMIQKLTNATNNLFSMTSVNSNALGAQLQNAEGDYKSFLAVITKMMQSLFQVISQSQKRAGN